MRNRYLVAYDVSDEKRLRRTFHCLQGYGDPVQYSIFSCDLSSQEKLLMLEAINRVVNRTEDRVMVINLGPAEGEAVGRVETIGKKLEGATSRSVVL